MPIIAVTPVRPIAFKRAAGHTSAASQEIKFAQSPRDEKILKTIGTVAWAAALATILHSCNTLLTEKNKTWAQSCSEAIKSAEGKYQVFCNSRDGIRTYPWDNSSR
jgi:hypothetical protein